MTWEQEAEAVAKALYPDDSESHRLRRVGAFAGFLYGSGAALTWASNAEAVKRAARGIHASHDRGSHFEAEDHAVQEEYRAMARAALTAAIGGQP